MKPLIKSALVYAIVAMLSGVVFREWTKAIAFTGKTTLVLLHTHYFALGMIVFLLLLVLTKIDLYASEAQRGWRVVYHIGLNLAGVVLFLRGLGEMHVMTELPATVLTITAGVGHACLGVSLVVMLVSVARRVTRLEVR